MRPVLINDLNISTRVLMAVLAVERASLIDRIIENAQVADRYRKRTGKPHLRFGNGSLSGACQPFQRAPMPARCNRDYLASLAVVVQGLRDRSNVQ